MRVCMVTSVHKHDDVRIYHKEAKALADAGHEVTILSPDYSGTDRRGIRFIGARIPGSRTRRMLCSNQEMLRCARRIDADIYHIHDPELLPSALALKKTGKRVVYDAHEDVPRQLLSKNWIPRHVRGPAAYIAERYEVAAAGRLDLVVGATRHISRRFHNSVTVHNYPDPAEFAEIPALAPAASQSFCYAGALTENRGILTACRAVQGTEGRLLLAGEFENAGLRERILGQGAGGKIFYHGCLGRRDVVRLMSGCLAGLLVLEPTPAYQMSMPIKLFEYLLAGIPVIASDFPFWRRLIGEECAVFVPPGDPAALSAVMNWMIKNPERARAMGEKGREIVLKRFVFEKEKKALLSAYERLGASSSG